MTSVTADNRTDTDVDILSELDFEPVLACEYSQHSTRHVEDDPAAWLVDVRCDECGRTKRFTLCESGRVQAFIQGLRCYCGRIGEAADFWKSIVPLDIR